MSYLDNLQAAKEIEHSIFVAHSLFERNKVTGSTANLSFRAGDKIFVSATGSCFGTLSKEDFSVIDLEGNLLEGRKPSKEYPMHLCFYRKDESIGAVLHTHSFYATLWSCLINDPITGDIIPKFTPYLSMKLGKVGIIGYAPPGSQDLFEKVKDKIMTAKGFLLANHGPIVPGKNIMDAFYSIEELEESCHLAWELRHDKDVPTIANC